MIRHEIYRDLRLRSTFTAMWRGFLITGREGGGFFGRTKATILDFEKKKKRKTVVERGSNLLSFLNSKTQRLSSPAGRGVLLWWNFVSTSARRGRTRESGRNDGSLCSAGRVQSSSLVGRGYLWSREEAWNERRRAERRREKEGERGGGRLWCTGDGKRWKELEWLSDAK